jgi:N-glycosidase YbiA
MLRKIAHRTYGPLDLPYAFDLTVEPILGFEGDFEFLSNFFPHPVVTVTGILPSSEHAYMIQKDDDPEYKKKIRAAKTPGKAKRIGYTAKLPDDWDEVRRYHAMHEALKCKFVDKQMAQWLIETGFRYLEETNRHGDTFWGRCEGRGKNHLGRQLMVIRHMLVYQKLMIRK